MINERICVEFEKKQQHNIGFPTFKLPASTKYQSFVTGMLNTIFDHFGK